MKKIYKYIIADLSGTSINLPVGANIIRVGSQGDNQIVFWAEIPAEEQKTTERIFCIVATGEVFDESCHKYIGTVQIPSKSFFHEIHGNVFSEFVWHVYELMV